MLGERRSPSFVWVRTSFCVSTLTFPCYTSSVAVRWAAAILCTLRGAAGLLAIAMFFLLFMGCGFSLTQLLDRQAAKAQP